MDETRAIIDHQDQELRARDEYIGVLEFVGGCLGLAVLVLLVTTIYLLYR